MISRICEELTGAVTVTRVDVDGYTLADVVMLYDDGPVVWV
jgi:hypothetical protein